MSLFIYVKQTQGNLSKNMIIKTKKLIKLRNIKCGRQLLRKTSFSKDQFFLTSSTATLKVVLKYSETFEANRILHSYKNPIMRNSQKY